MLCVVITYDVARSGNSLPPRPLSPRLHSFFPCRVLQERYWSRRDQFCSFPGVIWWRVLPLGGGLGFWGVGGCQEVRGGVFLNA